MKFLRCVLVLLCVTPGRGALADGVDDYLTEFIQKRRIPGLSLAVIKDGKVIKAEGYGFANVETMTPATPETVYKIGSISNSFVAAGILLLAEQGRLSLDDKAAQYLNGAPKTWNDITIRHLVAHTSGLVETPPGYRPFEVRPLGEIIASIYSKPLHFAPGEKWSYSNAAYFVLAGIIERVTGRPWSAFIDERLFAPVGMTATRTTTSTAIVPHRASGYEYRWDAGQLEKAPDWVAVRPSGAFFFTVLDMARWDAVLDSNTVLKASVREQMWTPTKLNNGKSSAYGLGWFIDSWHNHRRVHHDGELPGFRCDYERFVDDRLSVIVMFNEESVSSAPNLALKVAGFYVPDLAPVYKPIADRDPELTARAWSLIQGLIENHPDLGQRTPELVAGLTDAIKAAVPGQLRRHGVMRSMDLFERENAGDLRLRRYQLTFPDQELILQVAFNRDGRIAGFGVRYD